MYYISVDSDDCFKTDEVTGRRSYKHDYYIDNPQYNDGVTSLVDKLANYRSYIYSELIDTSVYGKNITNH